MLSCSSYLIPLGALINVYVDTLIQVDLDVKEWLKPNPQGFDYHPGANPVTKGIWIWRNPFIIKSQDKMVSIMKMVLMCMAAWKHLLSLFIECAPSYTLYCRLHKLILVYQVVISAM